VCEKKKEWKKSEKRLKLNKSNKIRDDFFVGDPPTKFFFILYVSQAVHSYERSTIELRLATGTQPTVLK